MNTNHTPGPWAWQLFGDTYTLTAQHGRREQIISAIPHREMKYPVVAMNLNGILCDVDPQHPNARLIAAAPDLLSALQATIETWNAQAGRVFESMGQENPRAQAIDEAITKASEAISRATKGGSK